MFYYSNFYTFFELKNTFGEFCEKSSFETSDPCLTNPCYNGGKCEPLDSVSYRCNCNATYGGISCKQTMMGGCSVGASRCQRDSICVPVEPNGIYTPYPTLLFSIHIQIS